MAREPLLRNHRSTLRIDCCGFVSPRFSLTAPQQPAANHSPSTFNRERLFRNSQQLTLDPEQGLVGSELQSWTIRPGPPRAGLEWSLPGGGSRVRCEGIGIRGSRPRACDPASHAPEPPTRS